MPLKSYAMNTRDINKMTTADAVNTPASLASRLGRFGLCSLLCVAIGRIGVVSLFLFCPVGVGKGGEKCVFYEQPGRKGVRVFDTLDVKQEFATDDTKERCAVVV